MENRISAVVSRVIAARLAVGVGLCALSLGFTAIVRPTYSFASSSSEPSTTQTILTDDSVKNMEGCEAVSNLDKHEVVIRPKDGASEGVISAYLKQDDFERIHSILEKNEDSDTTLKFEGTVYGYGSLYLFDNSTYILKDFSLFSACKFKAISNDCNFDVSHVTNMKNLFRDCKNLTSLKGLENWNVSNVTDMSHMFSGCTSLIDISGLANWNTANVTTMQGMFGGQVTYLLHGNKFNGCEALEDVNALQSWNTANVTDMSYMFSGCTRLKSLKGLEKWNTENVTTMEGMFAAQVSPDNSVTVDGCESIQNVAALSKWKTSKVTKMNYMFSGCKSLSDISGLASWNTSSVTTMRGMFAGYSHKNINNKMVSFIFSCESLTNLKPLANWNVRKVTDMAFMFRGCKNLKTLDGLEKWKTESLTTMRGMFSWYCSGDSEFPPEYPLISTETSGSQTLENISGLAKWNTSKVTDMSYLFFGCDKLTSLVALKDWNTKSVTTMKGMFAGYSSNNDSYATPGTTSRVPGCEGLKNLSGLDSWDTGKVTDMSFMFVGCKNLENLAGLNKWNTENVTTMEDMFGGYSDIPGCEHLTNVDAIANWNVQKVTKMGGMFGGCKSLTNLNGLTTWKTNGYLEMIFMFSGCENLTDIRGIKDWKFCGHPKFFKDTPTLTRSIEGMFSHCKKLSDISPIEDWPNTFYNGNDMEVGEGASLLFGYRDSSYAPLKLTNIKWFRPYVFDSPFVNSKEAVFILNIENTNDDNINYNLNTTAPNYNGDDCLPQNLKENLFLSNNDVLLNSMNGITAENDNYHVLKVTYKGASETSHMPSVLDSRINGKDAKPSSDPFEIVKHHLPSIVAGGAGDLPNKNEQPSNYLALADYKLLTSEELSAKGNDDPNAKLMQLFQQYTIKPARDVQFMSEGKEVATIKCPLDGTIGELANETVVTKDAVLTGVTMPKDPVKEGYIFKEWNTKPDGSGETFTSSTIIKGDGSKPLVVYAIFIRPTDPEVTALYRLYNPYTHEHFFTAETVENDNLVRLGWKSEGGVGYIYKHGEKGGVYRLYNPSTGEHHYTMKEDEVAKCVKAGWKNEGVKWFSAQNKEVTLNKLYSMYNPYEKKFYHHYTADAKEIEQMVKAGWRKEEVKWCTLPLTYNAK